jgi:hypothetical protein
MAMRGDEVRAINRDGWDRRVAERDVWSRPVSAEETGRARLGDWSVVLTPNKPVPRDWFGAVAGRVILCLASGGGPARPDPGRGRRPRGRFRRLARDHTVEFSHTLETQIAGQLKAGFVFTHLFEDTDLGRPDTGPARYFSTMIATRALKL